MQGSVIAPGAAPARAGSCCRRGAAGGGAAHCPQHERLQTPTAARRTTSGLRQRSKRRGTEPDPGGDPERRKSATASRELLASDSDWCRCIKHHRKKLVSPETKIRLLACSHSQMCSHGIQKWIHARGPVTTHVPISKDALRA